MKFVFPCIEYKEKAIEYIAEFYEYQSEVNGAGGLDRFLKDDTYENWLVKVRKDIDIANILPGKVPALTYFYVSEDTDQIVGMVNIRLSLNDFLREEGGHIGYSIRPTMRKHHYATQMLQDALKIYHTLGIRNVIVSCDTTNIASAKVIQNNGGVLDKELYSEHFHEMIQRYIISEPAQNVTDVK